MKRVGMKAILILVVAALAAGIVWLSMPRTPPAITAAGITDHMFTLHFDLGPDEVVRSIPLPGSPVRFGQLGHGWMGVTPAMAQTQGSMLFYAGQLHRFWGMSTGDGNVAEAMSDCGSFTPPEMDIPKELAELTVPGDWVVDRFAPRERRMAALEQILRQRLHRPITIRRKVESRPALIARGSYAFRSIGTGRKPKEVQLFTDQLDPAEGAGGGSGNLRDLLRRIESITHRRVYDDTDSWAVACEWSNNHSCWGVEKDEHQLDLLLANLTRQTGLTFEKTMRDVEIYLLREERGSAAVKQ